jgi:hypothetical protein
MRKAIKESAKPRGFYRVNITEGGAVVGDSGWKENTVVNDGVTQYLINWLVGATASGKSVTHAALGTGGAPAVTDTALAGEVSARAAVSTSIISSRTAQFTAQFASGASFVSTTLNISNIGLFNTVTAGVGTIFAGNTYASSSCATNQNVMCKALAYWYSNVSGLIVKLLESLVRPLSYNAIA